MAKDSAQSKIPRLDGVTRIPVSGSIRIPSTTASAHHHHLHHHFHHQKTPLSNNKILRPSTCTTGLHSNVKSITSMKKPLSSERISETACFVGKKTASTVKKYVTKPSLEKSSNVNVVDMTATTVKMITKDETIILDKVMKDDVNQKLMITGIGNGVLCGQQQQQSQDHSDYSDNKSRISSSPLSKVNDLMNKTKTLTRSETFIQDKNSNDDNNVDNETHNKNSSLLNCVAHNNEEDINDDIVPIMEKQQQYQHQQQQMQSDDVRQFNSDTIVIDHNKSNESSSLSKTRTIELAASILSNDFTATLETNSKLLNYDMIDNFSNERLSDISIPSCDLEGHNKEQINTSEDFDATITLAPDKGENQHVFNSTFNTEQLLDITTNKLSPAQTLLNIAKSINNSPNYEQNTTKLLYMTPKDVNSPVLGSRFASQYHNQHQQSSTIATATNDHEPMEIDDLSKMDENKFEISANVNHIYSSHTAQHELKQNKPRYSFGLDLTECILDCSIDLCDVSFPSSTAQAASPQLKKQNSFEMDESLGILTPDQMKEFLDSTTTTTNLDLPINIQQAGSKSALHQMRIDQTPSPEDLPLDPVGVKTDIADMVMTTQPSSLAPVQNLITYQEISQTDSDSKTDQMIKSSASKVSNSFITSVTSITSLDTGYQGDGEMSRPASRGPADHSPSNGPRKPHLGRQPSFNHHNPPNIPIRRQDPMTDSDFFTESDADDIFHRGDRRAQVIDGQLYGPMLQPANVFITEQPQMEDSCMESSGIFTDVENRCDDELSRSRREADVDMSPDSSTDTVKSNTEYNNNSNSAETHQLQQSVSPMSQSNSNILTDSQTSSTIQSSLSSEPIDNYSKQQNINISTTIALKSLSNSGSSGALNIVNPNAQQQNDDNDKKSSITQTHTNTITTESPTSQSASPSQSSVKKVSPSRKQQQHSHGIVGGKYEKTNLINVNNGDVNNLTNTGSGSIVLTKSTTNVSGNTKKSISIDQCDNERSGLRVNSCDDNITNDNNDDNQSRDMLEKSSIGKNSNCGNNSDNNQENSPINTSPTISIANNVISAQQTSPTPRKVMVNKWDAVMNKIAENKSVYKKNYSEVKSKVASGVVLKRSKPDTITNNNKNQRSGKQSQVNSNCGSLNSINGLQSPKTTSSLSGKRVVQSATKRGRLYSKDSQQSSQSDISLSGSPKLLSKLPENTRSAKKRDVRTLSISPTDLGPPPKSQTNVSSRTKQSSQVLLQKRLSTNVDQTSSHTGSNKNSPSSAKKITTSRRPQAQQQQSHTKTPLKDHNRLITQQQQQQLNHLNGSAKTAGNVIKGIPPTATVPSNTSQSGIQKTASHTSQTAISILDDINVTTTPTSLAHSVQSHKKQHLHLQQQQQQLQSSQKDQKSSKEVALELHLAHANKSVEALGVLLQYLVYDLDAFVCPSTKKRYINAQKNLIETRLLLEEAKTSCHELQDQLQDKEAYYIARESELQTLHRCELKKVESSLNEIETNAKDRITTLENQLKEKDTEYGKKLQEYIKSSEEKIANYEKEINVAKEKEQELLKRISALSTTENELREKIQEAESNFGERLKQSALREKELNEKTNALNKELDELRHKTINRERELEDKLNLSHDEISVLRLSRNSFDQITSPKNGTTVNGGGTPSTGANKVQMLQNEVESLRSVLELKQSEVSELRIKNQEIQRTADELPAMQMKISALESRIEDLQIQLKAKAEEEKELVHKNKHLQDSLTHEIKNRSRLTLHNEELQWRLKQNSEKFALTLAELSKSYHEQVGFLNSSVSRTSINSQDNLDLSHNSSLLCSSSRTNGSDRNVIGCFEMDDVSPPASPIIKGVVEKSESVSWVLEMDDESPEVLASRMVRRAGSFRSSFSEKSPGNSKRQYAVPAIPSTVVNPLTQSASATAVLRQHSNESVNDSPHPVSSRIRSKSVTIKSPEQKKITRQSLSGGDVPSRKSEFLFSSSWKDPVCVSSPYTRRLSNSRSPPKDAASHLLAGVTPTSTLKTTKSRERADSFNTDTENGLFNQKHEPNLITCDTSALTSTASERIEMRSMQTHPSVQDLKNLKKCQEIQESAGEAMVSGTNSEDEGCSASSDEALVTSTSSTSTSSLETDKQHNMSLDCILIEKINCSLGGTPMEVSWSDDGEQYPSESIV